MTIKWSNLLAFALAILAVVLTVRHGGDLRATVSTIGQLGPRYTIEEKTLGFCVLGVILVSLVAIVRLVLSNDRRNDR